MFPRRAEDRQQSRAWFDSASARRWQTLEAGLLADLLPRLAGYRCVSIGAVSVQDSAPDTRCVATLKHWHGDVRRHAGVDFVYDGDRLPLASHSVDVLILRHAVELAEQPHRLIRECARVLSERGQLVVMVYNPWSLWALAQLPGRQATAFRPLARPPRAARLIDWLRVVALETTACHRYGPGLARWSRIAPPLGERAGARWIAWSAGGYALVARRHALRRIPPGGQRVRVVHKPALAGAGRAAACTARQTCAKTAAPDRMSRTRLNPGRCREID